MSLTDLFKQLYHSDCYRFMSITIQFLISFLRDKIPGFDDRANSYRRCVPKNPKNSFTEEIWNICKDHAKTENDLIELEEGRHTKKDHSNHVLKCCSRISSKYNQLICTN